MSYLLFGEAGTSLKTLTDATARKQAFLAQQQAMSRALAPGTAASCFSWDAPTLTSSRLCDVNEFQVPEIYEQLLALGFDPTDIHRKNWEKAAVAFLVEHFGYFDDQSAGLGLGVAKESLLYLLSNHCGWIVGIDLYQPVFCDGAGMTCEEVYASAPFPYRRERLEIVAMDMRSIDFPDATFDFVWSVSSVEHVNSIDELITVFRHIERVLKPGGHAFITTEWNRVSQNPVYAPGAILFDEVLYPYLLSRLDNLRPLTPLHLRQPYHPDHFFAQKWTTSTGLEMRPCVNLFSYGTFITPVLLILRKALQNA
ncbi:MAG: class I SAM-dependent methyltransferase [Chloroflexi bacterium]|nr:class I SAM-dependent methyltransferase [Chloroflexota bacterium]